LGPVNHGKKFVVDNIGPRCFAFNDHSINSFKNLTHLAIAKGYLTDVKATS
jgi:hypothetical protein